MSSEETPPPAADDADAAAPAAGGDDAAADGDAGPQPPSDDQAAGDDDDDDGTAEAVATETAESAAGADDAAGIMASMAAGTPNNTNTNDTGHAVNQDAEVGAEDQQEVEEGGAENGEPASSKAEKGEEEAAEPEQEGGLMGSSASEENNKLAADEEGEGAGSMEVEATDDQEPSPGEEEGEEELAGDSKQQQEAASYSTRGRTTTSDDPLERLAREALGELIREKPPSAGAAMRESFLSDSITEEERRTRTRYVPQVEGMHALRRHETKGDVALSRTNFSSVGVAGTVAASKAKAAKRGGTNAMDVDLLEDGVSSSVDDDRASDILRVGTKTVEIGANDLVLPSTAFLAPPSAEAAKPSGTGKAAPDEVEAVTAFNPPRPPESIGPKKRHRMLRWERRPADIEVDLNNYRKTVHRTREELKSAQEELDRLETVDNHLRRNFFLHLQSLGEEWKVLNGELSSVQQECVNSAELLTSRTRSRGAGKSSYAMRDVLAVLRTRGQAIDAGKLSLTSIPSLLLNGETATAPGIGGVGAVSFADWDRSTVVRPAPVASAWILPGDTVQTPYGDGTVVAVFGGSQLDVNEQPHKGLGFGRSPSQTEDRMDTDEQPATGQGATGTSSSMDTETPKGADAAKDGEGKSNNNKKGSKSKKKEDDKSTGANAPTPPLPLPPRVGVRLPYGVGFFPVKYVIPKEDPSTYSDARLALRWKGLVETAAEVGGVLDMEAMAAVSQSESSDALGMEIEEGGADGEQASTAGKTRLLPFGAGMFPTAIGRGDALYKLSFEELDKAIDSSVFDTTAVLGNRDNAGVPSGIRKREDDRQERLDLQGQVLQLKNQLYRQRRVRMLNERTYAAGQDRAGRMESLVAEMRTDLKTLKHRLDEEIVELGISEGDAEKILTQFYESFDSKDEGEVSLQKKPRRLSRLETEEDDLEEDDDEQMDLALELGSSQH